MSSDDSKGDDAGGDGESTSIMQPPRFNDKWRERILYPTIVAGIAGAAVGAVSKRREASRLPGIVFTYAANFAIVAGCFCGAREYVRVGRKTEFDDLLNSAAAGFGTGAILGRLQGGQLGALRYSILFSIAGTAIDYATIKLRPSFVMLNEKKHNWLKWPEWAPIRVLDEEEMAAKAAREKELHERVSKLRKKPEN